MDYCIASLTKKRENELYRAYVTDCLKNIVHNTATFKGALVMNERYINIIHPELKKKEEPKDTKQVVSGIRNKLKG